MDKALAELVKISNTVGRDRWLVIGKFGNTSVKNSNGKSMYIKASGTNLKDMKLRSGWRRLNVSSAIGIIDDKSITRLRPEQRLQEIIKSLLGVCDDNIRRPVKPSIESCFHAMLDRYVIHLHPENVLPFLCVRNGCDLLNCIFKAEKYPPLWVPYAEPGYGLAKRMKNLLEGYKKIYNLNPAIIFLQNHGLVINSDSLTSAMNLVGRVTDKCQKAIKIRKTQKIKHPNNKAVSEAAGSIREGIYQTSKKRIILNHYFDKNISDILSRKDGSRLCSIPAITPDEYAYVKGSPMWLDGFEKEVIKRKLNNHLSKGYKSPLAFLIKPVGLFIIGNKKRANLLKEVISTYISVRCSAAGLGSIRSLTKLQQEFVGELYGID